MKPAVVLNKRVANHDLVVRSPDIVDVRHDHVQFATSRLMQANLNMIWQERWRFARMSLAQLANAWFPDRQLLIRGPGNVRSFHLSKSRQMMAAGCLVLLVIWSVIASAAVMVLAANQVVAVVERSRLAASLADEQAKLRQAQAASSRLEQASAARLAQATLTRVQAVAEAHAVIAAYHKKLLQMTSTTQAAIERVQSIITMTGVNPDSLVPKTLQKPAAGSRPDAVSDTTQLRRNLARLGSLSDLLERMPLATPVGYVSVSSPFGFRPDPWTGDREFHVGIDLRGPIGSPVYATARGIVSFAGTQTGYGNIVIIEHGFGLSTRYSHLSKILVHVGADVDLHQVIGLLGSTGWSTGPHLLYETRVDGQPYDPLNFMKVNRYGVQN
jgi:murein DD-endopeptidase MepM/ murein hydrolase activator NlpD